MDCTTQEVIEKARIHCPTCKRDYALYRLEHICNPVLPCDQRTRRPKYIERYIESKPLREADIYMPIVACDPCNEADKLKSMPRKQMCPKCEYVGFYVSDESKLCPVCKIVPQDKPKRRPTMLADAPPVEQVGADAVVSRTPLPIAYLYGTVTLRGKDGTATSYAAGDGCGGIEYIVPSMGVTCTHIEVVGWTSKSILSGNWYPIRWGFAFNSEGDYAIGMSSLAACLDSLRQTYTTRWETASMAVVARLWIWNLFNAYGPEDKSELGYYV